MVMTKAMPKKNNRRVWYINTQNEPLQRGDLKR